MAGTGCALAPQEPAVEHEHTGLALANGLTLNGLGTNGVAVNGLTLNGLTLNGLTLNGTALNGLTLNGLTLNGTALNGLTLNGLTLNGLTLNGLTLNGLTLNGLTLNGLTLNGAAIDGEALTDDQVLELKTTLRYLAECALDVDQCITIYDVDDTPLSYCGVMGLDTDWASQPPDLYQSEVVASCVMTRAGAAGDEVIHAPVHVAAFKEVLTYMVECALPAGDSVTVYDENDQPMSYDGALGLAPEWRDSALGPAGQRRVSACMAARTNALRQPVQLSLRGAEIPVTEVEQTLYDTHEGAFWGDLFAADPYVRTCLVEGGGLSGRVCAETGTCGFELMGDCSRLCTSQDAQDSAYSGCAGESEVLNTFLDLGQQIGFGIQHNCMREHDGSLWCWGKNNLGQLGLGATSQQEFTPLQVTTMGNDTAEASAGHGYSCARKSDGSLWCWGKNDRGTLGDGTTVERHSPVRVAALGYDVASVGASQDHVCAHKTDGSLWCWGKNSAGAVGDGSNVDRTEPAQITALGYNVAGVSSGSCATSTCAIENDGSLWCWGQNDHGQVGDGSKQDQRAPVQVTGDSAGQPFTDVTDVCSGAAHTCARKADGSLWCWGQNAYGQLGDGTAAGQDRLAPVQVALPGQGAPHGLSCGCRHTCAVAEDSTLWCWGDNSAGALGSETEAAPTSPVQVSALGNDVARVTATDARTCATLNDRTLWCWGEDEYQIILPTTGTDTPVRIDL